MLTAIVVVYLFGLGLLVLVGLWRIDRQARRAERQRMIQARRLVRVTRRIVRMGKVVQDLAKDVLKGTSES